MPVTFTKTRLPNGWLGNMSAFPIMHEGLVYQTAEHLFQVLRFSNPAVREVIRLQRSPMSAKMKAKQYSEQYVVTPTSPEDLANMRMVLKLKVEQHPELMKLLVDTFPHEIIEDVTNRGLGGRNGFWGAALKDGEWVGQNVLGKMWMSIRDEIMAKI